MAAAEPSSSDSPPPSLRRRERRLVFDRRYGWILDEWTNPAHQALSGGRGMFCVVPLAQSLVDAAASSLNHLADLEFYLNLLSLFMTGFGIAGVVGKSYRLCSGMIICTSLRFAVRICAFLTCTLYYGFGL